MLVLTSINVLAQSPILSNFRIEEANKNRIYFESSEPITGSSVTGFYLSDNLRKRVTGLHINPDQLTGHYFTSSEAFDYWDTYAIRYEGGSDIQDLNSNGISEFWLTEVLNEIPEPAPSGIPYFVRTTGDDSNDGLTHETAFRTINRAVLLKAKTIYVEAGDYGVEKLNFNYKGTATEPIVVQGYKTITNGVPDPIEENYWKWGVHGTGLNCVLDSSEMPTLTGNSTIRNDISAGGRAFRTSDFLIIKNFQTTRFNTGFFITGSDHLVLKNINVLYSGRLSDARGYAIFAQGGLQGINAYNKFININTAQGISMVRWYGGASLLDNVKVYNDTAERAPDYFISNYEGSNSIIKNCLVDKIGGSGGSHGISLKSWSYVQEYNLIVDCEAINMMAGVELRHDHVKNTVVRNFVGYSRLTDSYTANELCGIVVRDNSSANKIENATLYRLHRGIYFTDQSGEQGYQTPGFDNIFRNIVIYNSNNALGHYGTTTKPLAYGNYFENLTIDSVKKMYWTSGPLQFNSSNFLINSTISNVERYGVSTITEFNNNYFNNGFRTPSGTNITELDPMFVNPSNADYHLQTNSPIKDIGRDISRSRYDYDGVERVSGKYSIGAYEDMVASFGSVSPDISICAGESTTLVASGGASYSWDTGETTESITVTPTDTTTYSVDISNGVETETYEIVVTVDVAPSVDAGADVTMCEGETITLTATGEGDFLWSTGETAASIEVSPTATTTYTVTASNSCATEATDEVLVTVNPGVTVDLGADVSICVGESTTLTAIGVGPFSWSTGETTASITVNPSATTTYTVTSSNGTCSDDDDIIVTVNTAPSVTASADTIICEGETIELTATGEGDFLWSTGETSATIYVAPTTTTTYTVTASNSCSTEVTDEVLVTVNPSLNLDAGADVSICLGESATLTATGTGPFNWNTGETTASITVNPTTTTTYTVSSTSGACDDTDEIIVNVSNPPSVVASADTTVCEGEIVTLTATGEGDFLWSTGETGSRIDVSPTATTTYTVTASNSCTASATDEVLVTVSPNVTVNAGTDVSICVGESTTLTATGTGPFNWSTGETTASITVSPTATTTYTVISDNGTCSDSDEVIVTLNNAPSANAGADMAICEGETITLTATGEGDFLWSTGETTTSISVSPTATTLYTVTASNSCATDASDEILITVNPSVTVEVGPDVTICEGESLTLTATGNGDEFFWSTDETTQSITVSPTATTTYIVTSIVGGCSNTDEMTVNVVRPPTVYAGSDVTICEGATVTLTATGEGSFLWSTGETTASINVSPSVTTAYTVTGASNSCSTEVTDEVLVMVNPSVTVNAGPDVAICEGESTTLTAMGTGPFNWSTGETTASITVNPTSTSTYTVSSGTGPCLVTDDVVVSVNQAASVNAGADMTICEGGTITLTATGEGNFLWSTGETTATITVSPNSTTTYTVTASNSCTGGVSDEVLVTVIPNANVNAGADVAICFGESTTLTATGTGPFSWSTGETTASINVSPTDTTIYTVSAGAAPCVISDTVTVNVNAAVAANAGDDVTICEGDSVTLTVTGEGDFLWSTGETTSSITVNPLETTTYSVSASNSCASSSTDEVIVNVNKTPVATANDDITILAGSSVDLTVSGVGSFEWSTGEIGSRITVTPTETTTYTVTATTGEGCAVNDEVVVTVVDEYAPTETTITVGQNMTICPSDIVILEAPTGTRYLWNSGGTERSIKVSPSETTIYSVKVYNGDESETYHSTITVTENCSEAINLLTDNGFDLNQEMTVYPNPTKGLLNIKLKGYNNDTSVSVYNLNGTMIYSGSVENKSRSSVLKEQLDLSKFPKGIYFVKVNNNGKSETKKVIVM